MARFAEPVRQPTMSPTVLLVEDEPGIVDFVRRGLQAAGFEVQTALDGLEGEQLALHGAFDVILLDLMLPGRTGEEILAALQRVRPSQPVILLTARGEIDDRVAGLNAGAVDYLVKPFALRELVARVRAQLRSVAQATQSTLQGGDIAVDLLTRSVWRRGEPSQLSSTEFALLIYLLRHRGYVLRREQILAAVWGYQHDPTTNVVDVYIGYLRRKLRRGDSPVPIATVRGVGYRLDDVER